jgi:hypothetical protein
MKSDDVQKKVETLTKTQKLWSVLFGVTLTCFLFAFPLGLFYNFVHYQNRSMFSGWILFIMTVLLGYTSNLLYYRVVVMNDITAKIDKMNSSIAGRIFGITIMSFLIVGFTLFIITINPSLTSIFENTIGMWGIGFWGLKRLANEIFYSPTMDEINKNIADSNDFNYGFLVSQFTRENVDEIIEASKNCENTKKSPLLLDFKLRFTTREQIHKLKDLVNMKNSLGHFMWIYLSSIVALLVSMIAMMIQ